MSFKKSLLSSSGVKLVFSIKTANVCINVPEIIKNRKDLTTLLSMRLHNEEIVCSKPNINVHVNVQSTIVKKCLNDIFKMTKSIFVEKLDANFDLQILVNQRFGTYAEGDTLKILQMAYHFYTLLGFQYYRGRLD